MDFSKHTDKFSVAVNKTALGQVTYYKVEKIPVDDIDIPNYHIEIRRRIANNPERELVCFYTMDACNITFIRAGARVTFVKCVPEKITEEIGEDRLIYETVKLSAVARGAGDPNDPNNPFEELE